MDPRQPSQPAITEPTTAPDSSATMRAPESRCNRAPTASPVSVEVGAAAWRQSASTEGMSAATAGLICVLIGSC